MLFDIQRRYSEMETKLTEPEVDLPNLPVFWKPQRYTGRAHTSELRTTLATNFVTDSVIYNLY